VVWCLFGFVCFLIVWFGDAWLTCVVCLVCLAFCWLCYWCCCWIVWLRSFVTGYFPAWIMVLFVLDFVVFVLLLMVVLYELVSSCVAWFCALGGLLIVELLLLGCLRLFCFIL